MNIYQSLLLTSVLAAAAPTALFASETDKSPVSIHVLNLQTGVPGEGLRVELEQEQKQVWVKLSAGVTDKQGRLNAVWPQDKALTPGNYRVIFKTGDYFARQHLETFFPEISVMFHVAKTDEHYHIPLLLSQYGYSTYRGN